MNDILLIFPFKFKGTWVFNDASTGLFREPFVQGIPEIIDHMTRDIADAKDGFKLLFSSDIFPGSTGLKKVDRPDAGNGAWYYHPETDITGWLCPALFRYFPDKAPDQLYAKAEPMETEGVLI